MADGTLNEAARAEPLAIMTPNKRPSIADERSAVTRGLNFVSTIKTVGSPAAIATAMIRIRQKGKRKNIA
jgi:hypothetical protein